MGMTAEQWKTIGEATETLRAMGCAVCIFTVDDVTSVANNDETDITEEQAQDWMESNRRRLEDVLSTRGNEFIADSVVDLVSEDAEQP